MKQYLDSLRNEFNALHILCQNGWEWHHHPSDEVCIAKGHTSLVNCDYDLYTATFLGEYTSTVLACVSSHEKHLCNDGHYGVLWLEVFDYECEKPYSYGDLEDMQFAIECAERNLLKIGMPFTKDYKFYCRDEGMEQRNYELREMYHLDELEEQEMEC